MAGDGDGARVGVLESGDQAKRRRLAGAGRAEEDEELAVGDGEIDMASTAVTSGSAW